MCSLYFFLHYDEESCITLTFWPPPKKNKIHLNSKIKNMLTIRVLFFNKLIDWTRLIGPQVPIQSFISDYCKTYNLTIFTSGFHRKLVAGYLEEEDVGCWKEIFIPVVKSGRAASKRTPQLRAVRTHDKRDNRCADIKTPLSCWHNTQTQRQNSGTCSYSRISSFHYWTDAQVWVLHLLHCKHHSEMHFYVHYTCD